MKPSCIHDKCVLVLNRQWQAIAVISPAEAFAHMSAGNADALDIAPHLAMTPTPLEQWMNLEIRPHDRHIGTSRRSVRVPTIVVLRAFARVPLYLPKFSLKTIYQRDQGICQYSGRQLKPSEASIDHIIPRSRGGDTSWENCVLAERKLNSQKGARTPEEAGLKLIRRPIIPRPVPVTITLKNLLGIEEWNYFLSSEAA